MPGPGDLLKKAKRKVQSAAYGSRAWRMVLEQGSLPDGLRLSLPDPWPGHAESGLALIRGRSGLFDEGAATNTAHFSTHDWLRDLRAVGTDTARATARELVQDWLDQQDHWQEHSWSPDTLGARLANWIAFHDFYAAKAPQDFSDSLITSMVRQLRHLHHALPDDALCGAAALSAIKGLVYGGLALIDGEKSLSLALELLRRQLASDSADDGGHRSRNPSEHLAMLRALIDIRAALMAANHAVPPDMATAIARLVPALKLFRHGDGGLALFNGAREDQTLTIDAALTLSGARGRVLRRLPALGFERVTAGRSLLLLDVGAPPPKPYDRAAHAGLLSFEFSVGRERLIVNSGPAPHAFGKDAEAWRHAMAATAAHSAMTLADTNAVQVMAEGGLSHRPVHVVSQRYEQNGTAFVEASHDGYAARFRATHTRTLGLTADGRLLTGHETIAGPSGLDVVLRWHLHPSVQAALLQSGQAALLRLPSGSGWKLNVQSAGALRLDSGIYCGGDTPRRTRVLAFALRTTTDLTIIDWSLGLERK